MLGRDVAVTLPLISQLVPHFGEDPEDFATTLFEVAPTVLFTVPRYLQKFASQVLVGMLNSSAGSSARPTSSRCASPAGMRAGAGTADERRRSDALYARRCTRWCSGRS